MWVLGVEWGLRTRAQALAKPVIFLVVFVMLPWKFLLQTLFTTLVTAHRSIGHIAARYHPMVVHRHRTVLAVTC